MRLRACIVLLLFLSACTTIPPTPKQPAVRDTRLANLQRAATLPWTDGGLCAIQEASEPWPELAERCFHALDHDRIEFHDTTGRQVGVRVLWEIKTHQFDTYPDFIQKREIEKEMEQLDKQRKAAAACGYGFVVGVSTQAHKDALLRKDRRLNVVVTGCKR